jgi:hypothetical protein
MSDEHPSDVKLRVSEMAQLRASVDAMNKTMQEVTRALGGEPLTAEDGKRKGLIARVMDHNDALYNAEDGIVHRVNSLDGIAKYVKGYAAGILLVGGVIGWVISMLLHK